jgi:hypothetical protein
MQLLGKSFPRDVQNHIAYRADTVAARFQGAKEECLVLAHYMPCFPIIRSGDATDSYGYQLEFDPASEPVRANHSGKPYNW